MLLAVKNQPSSAKAETRFWTWLYHGQGHFKRRPQRGIDTTCPIRRVCGYPSPRMLAHVNKLVPYNAEQESKKCGAKYSKATLPFVSHAVFDGNLVTG